MIKTVFVNRNLYSRTLFSVRQMEYNAVLINKKYKINLNNLVTPLLITMTSASRRLLAPPMYLLQKQPLLYLGQLNDLITKMVKKYYCLGNFRNLEYRKAQICSFSISTSKGKVLPWMSKLC
jgi:hypothetical protein